MASDSQERYEKLCKVTTANSEVLGELNAELITTQYRTKALKEFHRHCSEDLAVARSRYSELQRRIDSFPRQNGLPATAWIKWCKAAQSFDTQATGATSRVSGLMVVEGEF